MKSSYQKRLIEIKYLRQRNKEADAIIDVLKKRLISLGDNGIVPFTPEGIMNEDFLTDLNCP